MDIDRVEPGARERGGHLDLAVDALLAQDRDARARAASRAPARRTGAGSSVEGEVRGQARRVRIEARGVLLGGARRIVAAELRSGG